MFGKKQGKPPTVVEVVQNLRVTEDLLIKKQEYLEAKIDKELTVARTNALKNKQAALQALKRKKRYEKQLQQVDGTLTTIEMQREALQEADMNSQVLATMKNAANMLKQVQVSVNVGQVHDLMDDIAEQQELASEILDALSAPVAFEDVDDDELEKELEALEDEALDETLLQVPERKELPTVPTAKVEPNTTKKADEDEDVKKLESWAS